VVNEVAAPEYHTVENRERHDERAVELLREGCTMALYVAICLLAVRFIAFVGFVVSRAGGGSWLRAGTYAAGMVVAGLTIAVLKNGLAGH
jgi:hypothetical protein